MRFQRLVQIKSKCLIIFCLTLSCFWIIYVNISNEDFEVIKKVAISTIHHDDIFVLPLSDEILDIHRRLNLTNPGYMGKPVKLPDILPEDIKQELNASYEEFKFNEFVSRLIPLDRELPDYRQGTCKNASNADNLPKVSVILSLYNEPFSMVMRTIYSILKNSPPELVEEILLVDDLSDKGEK